MSDTDDPHDDNVKWTDRTRYEKKHRKEVSKQRVGAGGPELCLLRACTGKREKGMEKGTETPSKTGA